MKEYKFTILDRTDKDPKFIFCITLSRIMFFHKLDELYQLYGKDNVKYEVI